MPAPTTATFTGGSPSLAPNRYSHRAEDRLGGSLTYGTSRRQHREGRDRPPPDEPRQPDRDDRRGRHPAVRAPVRDGPPLGRGLPLGRPDPARRPLRADRDRQRG